MTIYYRTILNALVTKGDQTPDDVFNTIVMNGGDPISRQEVRNTCNELYEYGVLTRNDTVSSEKWYNRNSRCTYRYTINVDYLLEPFDLPPRDSDLTLDCAEWADQLPEFNQDIGSDWRPSRLYSENFNPRTSPPPVPPRTGRPPLQSQLAPWAEAMYTQSAEECPEIPDY